MMQCIAEGHDVVALTNLRPKDKGKQRYMINNTVPEMWYGDFVFRPIFCRDREEILLRLSPEFDFLYLKFQTNWTVTCFRR